LPLTDLKNSLTDGVSVRQPRSPRPMSCMTTTLIPDRRGNNLIDGLRNLVEESRIGLIFFVPGVNET
jgi:uncharacterized protein